MNYLSLINNPNDKGDEELPDMINAVDDGIVIEESVFIFNQKHNVIFPEMLKISYLVVCQGTKKF